VSRLESLLVHGCFLTCFSSKKITTQWHEGSQIEPAQPMSFSSYLYNGQTRSGFTYVNYNGDYNLTGELAQYAYIDQTRSLSASYRAI
jgi:hypothetical protein